jgi:hypothetical protein
MEKVHSGPRNRTVFTAQIAHRELETALVWPNDSDQISLTQAKFIDRIRPHLSEAAFPREGLDSERNHDFAASNFVKERAPIICPGVPDGAVRFWRAPKSCEELKASAICPALRGVQIAFAI